MNTISNLYYPAFSGEVDTYICPITKPFHECSHGLRLANGWRYFEYLRVIQKHNNLYYEAIMSYKDLIKSAKSGGKNSLVKVEVIIDKLTRKRNSFSGLDMSSLHLMGIINLTPDSFYEKSKKNNVLSALEAANKMNNEGASIVDIGGESSRPGALKLSPDEEKNRVFSSIIAIKKEELKAKLSLDTRNLSTMEIGYKNGIDIINDISGFIDNKNINFISKASLPIIVMHMQNNPTTMQENPQYEFAPIDIYKILSKRIQTLLSLGVKEYNIVIDPGIGFGKNLNHNIEILKYLSMFHCLGVPILIGVSRKSLVEDLTIQGYQSLGISKTSIDANNRLSGSLSFAIHAYNNGIQIIRTHDVPETKQAIFCHESLN